MKIHHLNSGTLRPSSAALINVDGGWFERGRMVCHTLVVETNDGLLLVDTGFGSADVTHPVERLGRMFLAVTRPALLTSETVLAQLLALGLSAGDVRHIAVTHLDLDHAGGLSDFPAASIHVSAAEHAAAMAPRTSNEKRRYRSIQWAHGPKWAPFNQHAPGGDRWLGFDHVRALPGSNDEVLFIPLAGHTRGHTGIAVRNGDGWLLHAGDSHFCRGEVETPRRCPLGLRLFQTIVQTDGKERHANQARLAELNAKHGKEVRIVCAHDPLDLEDWD